jgi:phosphoribosylaminoimidazole carboxylase (NCAIR synthetase)
VLPGILKTARLGYDGKGQVRVTPPAKRATRAQRSAACRACSKSACR